MHVASALNPPHITHSIGRRPNILMYVIIDGTIPLEKIEKLAADIRAESPAARIYLVLNEINQSGRDYWNSIGVAAISSSDSKDLPRRISEDLMDLDWEVILWSRRNVEFALANLDRAHGLSNIESLLYYLELRQRDLPDWAVAFREIMDWQSLSVRGGVWQHYDGSVKGERYDKIYRYINGFGPGFRELAKVYISAVGKSGSNAFTDKIDTYIQDNEDLINRFQLRAVERNKEDILKWSDEFSGSSS